MSNERLITQELDGARILWRHWYGDPLRPKEGWVREFSVGGQHVRISKTNEPKDAGTWLQRDELRLVNVLEPAKAPVLSSGKDER